LLALFVAAIAAWVAWERRIVVGWRRSRLVLGAGDGDGADHAGSDGVVDSSGLADSKSGDGPTAKESSQSKDTDGS
jgi:hypothetical protein